MAQMDWNMVDDSEYQLVIFSRREHTFNLKIKEFKGMQIKQFKSGNKKEFSWFVDDLDVFNAEKRQKVLPVISNRLLRELKKHTPIEGKSLTITKVFERDEFDNYYEVKPILKQKKIPNKKTE